MNFGRGKYFVNFESVLLFCIYYLAGAFFICSPTKVALVMPISVLAREMTDRRCCVVTALDTPYVPLPTMSDKVSLRPVARDNCRSKDS